MRDARVSQPYVTRSYLAPERDSGDQQKAAALTLLADILGGGQTSHLAERLQFQTQTAVQVGASYSGLSLDDTTFDLFVMPAPGTTLEQAEAAMDDALITFLETGVDAEQLERIKMQIRASETYARDDAGGLAQRYGQALTQGLTVADVQAWPEILEATTAEEIMQAAREVLDRTQSVTGWLMAPEVTQ
jgi:zinc protease